MADLWKGNTSQPAEPLTKAKIQEYLRVLIGCGLPDRILIRKPQSMSDEDWLLLVAEIDRLESEGNQTKKEATHEA